MRAFAAFLLCLTAAACVTQQRIVTVVEPYVAEIDIENPDSAWFNGGTRCDRNGKVYTLISPRLSESQARFVRHHEAVHVEQVRSFGDCRRFMSRYDVDPVFRLHIEADAYCSTYWAQRKLNLPPDPDINDIILLLRTTYRTYWSREDVVKVLPCW